MRFIGFILSFLLPVAAFSDNGHKLWLRMQQTANPVEVIIDSNESSPTLDIATEELKHYLYTDKAVHLSLKPTVSDKDGFLLTLKNNEIYITSSTPIGILYGTYSLLRMQETGVQLTDRKTITEEPSSRLRILNHWDNLNGTVERGYAGRSIFWKDSTDLGIINADLIREYARANASIGINGTVLNNVNASPQILTDSHISGVKRIANILRPYGIKVYLSVNFASPMVLGGLGSADPINAEVIKWWQDHVQTLYDSIPDFGGFLVKANSEGEPGPQDFGRTHAEGANMLAHILKPHGGIVMWRAFVYSANNTDRACQAYDEFMPLDGIFDENVILQVKNGPIDFQPREPVHPLLLSMKQTKLMIELQITQEYLGESIHTVFLAPMWKETTDIVNTNVGIAGVSNIGDSPNWCGSDMAQANWYAFGRLAWNKSLTSAQIAREFVQQTFTKNHEAVEQLTDLLLQSHEACVSYMMPIGLHHIFAGGHHYGPEPWCYHEGWREDWLPRYYHRADSLGIGFDRTSNGSKTVLQYPDSLAHLFNDTNLCPEKYLLWFHHIGWNQVLPCGETLWNRLCHKYDEGVRQAESFVSTWSSLQPYIDTERYNNLKTRFDRQAKDAWWWRDACLLYFQQFSKQPFPSDSPACRHQLQQLEKFHLDIDNYTAAPIDKLP